MSRLLAHNPWQVHQAADNTGYALDNMRILAPVASVVAALLDAAILCVVVPGMCYFATSSPYKITHAADITGFAERLCPSLPLELLW